MNHFVNYGCFHFHLMAGLDFGVLVSHYFSLLPPSHHPLAHAPLLTLLTHPLHPPHSPSSPFSLTLLTLLTHSFLPSSLTLTCLLTLSFSPSTLHTCMHTSSTHPHACMPT